MLAELTAVRHHESPRMIPAEAAAVAPAPAAVPALPPRPKSARYQSLDIWRGVACLTLLVYHATFYAERAWRVDDSSTWSVGSGLMALLTRFWLGVPVFFVVSGYCIAASIDSLRRKPHSLRSYFARRFRRIYPPLWIVLGLAVAFTTLVSFVEPLGREYARYTSPGSFSAWNWLGNFFAAESWRSHLGGGPPRHILRNTWTLGYEEQFYAVCGVMLLCGARRFFTLAAAVTVLTLAARHLSRAMDVDTMGLFFDGHWLPFAAGIFVYQCVNYLPRKSVWLAGAVFLAGTVYALADQRGSSHPAERHLDSYMVVSFLFAFALLILKRWDTALAESRLLFPLRWCGRMSYSIYLTHFPLVIVSSFALSLAGVTSDWQVILVTLPLCLVVSLPAAWLFHVAVERRFINSPAAQA